MKKILNLLDGIIPFATALNVVIGLSLHVISIILECIARRDYPEEL